ncbi:High-copy suppressor of rspA [Blastochloris viridis]|uniref:High-copy suppressor of rspA n=1 Tax=Blastochloris viridis TaxID=1079 RepID=A0A0S4Q5X2_BLAVI|nr:High-copy suppressor of rspA [Blastochloris viridis]
MFMENMDATVIATSLPAIAADLGESPIALKLALTSYLLSLAVFIPASGWTADRFGARTVFRLAIAVFTVGSVACGFADSLAGLVAARVLQGMGGAMMTPVGRLLLVRSVDKSALVNAMAWLTVPALIGPMVGPPLGGWITTAFAWQWVFWINVPIGLIGIVLVTRYIEDVREPSPGPFDTTGFLLSGVGVAGLAFGLSVAGLEVLSLAATAAILVAGLAAAVLYVRHSRRTPQPILDLSLLAIATFRASFVGGFLVRVGVGALPFLLPLMLQLGFGLSPLQSGLITFAAAVGALSMKTVAGPILRRFGYRTVLTVNALLCAGSVAVCALFEAATPYWVVVGLLVAGGFVRSLQFTSINTIAFADIERARMSAATSLSSVGQQVSLSSGVAIGALVLETLLRLRGDTVLRVEDFHAAFLAVSLVTAAAALVFFRLTPDAGAALTARTAEDRAEIEISKSSEPGSR